jgi:hypothetical protein
LNKISPFDAVQEGVLLHICALVTAHGIIRFATEGIHLGDGKRDFIRFAPKHANKRNVSLDSNVPKQGGGGMGGGTGVASFGGASGLQDETDHHNLAMA